GGSGDPLRSPPGPVHGLLPGPGVGGGPGAAPANLSAHRLLRHRRPAGLGRGPGRGGPGPGGARPGLSGGLQRRSPERLRGPPADHRPGAHLRAGPGGRPAPPGAAPEPGRPGPPGAGPHRTGRAAVDGARPRVSYSFTAPEVSPETSWRCITKKMMTMGSAPKSAPAAKMPPRLLYWSEMKSCIPTGRVYWSVVCRMIRARTYSE